MAQTPIKPDFYYLETDGQVYLVNDRGVWRFPKKQSEIPCPFKPLHTIPFQKHTILLAKPVLKDHPTHWFYKDDLAHLPDIDSFVRRAINISLPRTVVKAVLIEKGHVLMVKGSRGMTQGIWNLPGGFMSYGEHPTESLRRELKEELGIRVKVLDLIGVYSHIFERTGGYMISFCYTAKRVSSKIHPDPTEISEYTWMPLRQALDKTGNPFARKALQDFARLRRH